MPSSKIFISYRRDDAPGHARAVGDEWVRRFGANRVFMDVDDIGAGQPFDEVMRGAVVDAQVLLVPIGRRWLGERDAEPEASAAGPTRRRSWQWVAAAAAGSTAPKSAS